MSNENRNTPNLDQAQRILEIQNQTLQAENTKKLAQDILPEVAALAQSESALIYIHPTESFYQYGFPPDEVSKLQKLCPEQMENLADAAMVLVSSSDYWKPQAKLALHALPQNGSILGFVGLMQTESDFPIESGNWEGFLRAMAKSIHNNLQFKKLEQQVHHLNTYMTISSMLAQPLGLHDMLEAALYCCMEATSAQAASVLLLGENKENFHFYQVAGPTKPVLDAATFPIDEGIAGSVLSTQESEIINDVQSDSRFYGKFDSESEFQTQNMIAIPLTAGEEKVGVLEVINKADEQGFTEDERFSLMMMAEEIAFAIHNARIFEYVVNSYCLIRQGEHSCRGCKRPLGSWTPCVKYRENITVMNMKPPL